MPTAQRSQGLGAGNPGYDNLDPTLKAIADRIIAESGGRVWIGSGWRSPQQQAAMHQAWLNGTYDVPRVASAERSQHPRGRAIDFGGDLQLAQQLGRRYGLIFPMSDEPWHGQLGGNVRYSGEPNYASLGINFNLGEGLSTPQEVIANRMNAVMSVLGGTPFSSGGTPTMSTLTGKSGEFAGKFATKGAGEVAGLGKAGGMASELGYGRKYMMPQVTGGPRDTQVSFAPTGDSNQLGTYAKSLFTQFGFDEADYPALVELWNRESGDPRAGSSQVTWDPTAQNPTSSAFGIAQFLNGTWKGTGIAKTTNPYQQILAGLMYIKSQYRNPRNALAFHTRHNWY